MASQDPRRWSGRTGDVVGYTVSFAMTWQGEQYGEAHSLHSSNSFPTRRKAKVEALDVHNVPAGTYWNQKGISHELHLHLSLPASEYIDS